MNLQELSGGTVASKPWLHIVASSLETKELDCVTLSAVYDVMPLRVTGPTVGAAPVQLTGFQFPSGVVVVGALATGTIVCPSSAAIDGNLGISTDGHLIWLDVINRNNIGPVLLSPPSGVAVGIPVPVSPVAPNCTRIYFTRVGGLWVCVNYGT